MVIRRVSTTRAGGVSAPPYDSFNLGDHVGDDPEAVAVNRARLATGIGLAPDHLVWMNQIHSAHVQRVDEPRTSAVDATDAVVTTTPRLALVVVTADCVPVLLGDARAGVVAAAHAGQVGARTGGGGPYGRGHDRGGGPPRGHLPALLRACRQPGPNYEYPESRSEVEAALPGSRTLTARRTPGLDLRAGIDRQLRALGITAVAVDPRCTVADRTLFSHRRGAPTGRLASVVWME